MLVCVLKLLLCFTFQRKRTLQQQQLSFRFREKVRCQHSEEQVEQVDCGMHAWGVRLLGEAGSHCVVVFSMLWRFTKFRSVCHPIVCVFSGFGGEPHVRLLPAAGLPDGASER